MRYRKRPAAVDAIQWTGDNHVEVLEFYLRTSNHRDIKFSGSRVEVTCAYGDMEYKSGDWIICHEAGDYFRNSAEAFAESGYEPVEDAS